MGSYSFAGPKGLYPDDIAFTAVATGLQLITFVPGVAVFERRLGRALPLSSVLWHAALVTALSAACWWASGDSLAFADTGAFIGDLSLAFGAILYAAMISLVCVLVPNSVVAPTRTAANRMSAHFVGDGITLGD
jgi:ammonia channel protein AmtB